jgi:hypothetical protein
MLYAQWQSSARDEDAADTHVYYSRSADGVVWSDPVALSRISDSAITTSGGWMHHGDTLVAFICVWPSVSNAPKSGYTEFVLSADGMHWSDRSAVTNAGGDTVPGIIEQDIHAYPGGRLITAFHVQPGLHATPYYTDDPMGVRGWRAGQMENLPSDAAMSRELEPAWFYRSDGAVVMSFRDQHSTFRKLASISYDTAKTWTTPVLVGTTDSRAKQCAGNLPDGIAYMVNNPSGNKNRFPLAITLSRDGFHFDSAHLLRAGGDDLQPMRYPGKYKRAGYSYPKSVIWDHYLYVSYATNKEDVELTRIPLAVLREE